MDIIEETKRMIAENAGNKTQNWDNYDDESDVLNYEFVLLNSDAFTKIIMMYDQGVTDPRSLNYEGYTGKYTPKKVLTIAIDKQKDIKHNDLCGSLVIPFLVSDIFDALDLNLIQLTRRDLDYILVRGDEEANLTQYICERFEAFDKKALLEFVIEEEPLTDTDLLALLNDSE